MPAAHPTMAPLPPAVSALLSESPPALPALRAYLDTPGSVRAPPAGAHRPLNEALLRALTGGAAQAASPAVGPVAARVALALVGDAPRAFDALVVDTAVRKVVKREGEAAARAVVARKKGRARGGRSGEKRGGVRDEEGLEKEERGMFWRELVALVKCNGLDKGAKQRFAGSAAVGFAGLLQASMDGEQRLIASVGFDLLRKPGAYGEPQTVSNLMFSVLLPVTVAPKLGAATRTTLATVLRAIVDEDESLPEASDGAVPEEDEERPMCLSNEEGRDSEEMSTESRPLSRSSSQEPALSKRISLAFIQACCLRVPERVDDRAALSTILLRLVSSLDTTHVERFANFVVKLSRQGRSLVRVFATELATALLPLALETEMGGASCLWVSTILEMLVERSSDKVPAVRAKAMAALATSIQTLTNADGEEFQSLIKRTAERLLLPDFDIDGRADDSKSGVRKSVIQLIGTFGECLSEQQPLASREPVSETSDMFIRFGLVAKRRCEDIVPTVRRLAISCITKFILELEKENDVATWSPILDFWMDGVLPRVVDSDVAVQKACLDSFKTLVLNPIAAGFGSGGGETVLRSFLRALCGGNSATARYTSTVVSLLSTSGSVDISVVQSLQDFLAESNSCSHTDSKAQIYGGAWALLAEVIEADVNGLYGKHVDGAAITEAALNGSGGRHACRIAAVTADNVSPADRLRLGKRLFDSLSNIAVMSLEGINAPETASVLQEMDAIPVMTRALASFDSSSGDTLLKLLDRSIGPCREQLTPHQLMRFLVLVGEVCLSFELSQEPPARLVNQVEACLEDTQEQPVRAMALAALGNICHCAFVRGADRAGNAKVSEGDLVSRRLSFGERLARRSIPVFVRELNDGGSIATRVNALIVLCDFCRRYTSIVEPHLGRMAMCLRDSSDIVRKRALASLTSLLQEDYLKLRGGPLFFRLVLSLLDNVEDIRRSTEYVLAHVLLPKSPMLFTTNFVEIVFVLNNCHTHSVYNRFLRSADETEANVGLSARSEDRFHAYHWILSRIAPEHRVGLLARLRQEILAPVCDGELKLAVPEVSAVFADSLKLFSLPEFVSLCNGGASGVEEDDEHSPEETSNGLSGLQAESGPTGNPSGGSVRTKAKIVAKIYELDLKEESLPLILDLKAKLEKKRSPVLDQIGTLFCAILRPYRKELGSFIEDSTLCAEIEYDMKQQDLAAKLPKAREGTNLEGPPPPDKSRDVGSEPASVTPGKRLPLQDATNAPRGRRATGKPHGTSALKGTPRRGTPAGKGSPTPMKLQTPSRSSRKTPQAKGQVSVARDTSGRLADAIAGSPRLSNVVASNRKGGSPVVFDINSSDGLVESCRRRTRSTRSGLARKIEL